MTQRRNAGPVKAAIVAGLIAVFIADHFMPLGVAIAVPYVGVVLLTLWLPDHRSVFWMASLISVLAIIGFFTPKPEGPLFGLAFQNRTLALFVIWMAAILGYRLLKEQEATRQERDFNESLVETASSIILLLDTQGRVLFFNQTTTDYLGHELKPSLGQDWFELCVTDQDRPRARGLFERILEKGQVKEGLFAVVSKSGQEFQFSWASRPMRDAENQIIQVLFVGQDVTSLLETQRKLVANERLAAIGQTIAAVSHESRNELMAMKMGLEMLSVIVTEPQAQQVIEHLGTSQARLHRLLEDVRHFAGPMQLEQAVCSLKDIWQRAWESLAKARKGRDAELHETFKTQELDCSVDALRIEQVFRNLFENSLAACPDPVWIEILVTEETQNGEAGLKISVRDNGPGLSGEAKAKVFEPFFTTKQRGTGLGMAISQRILTAHGGDLSLANTNKRGAEFLLWLPRSTPPSSAAEINSPAG